MVGSVTVTERSLVAVLGSPSHQRPCIRTRVWWRRPAGREGPPRTCCRSRSSSFAGDWAWPLLSTLSVHYEPSTPPDARAGAPKVLAVADGARAELGARLLLGRGASLGGDPRNAVGRELALELIGNEANVGAQPTLILPSAVRRAVDGFP